MEMLLNPILNAEIFKSKLEFIEDLERKEFVYLPSYETTNTDQKVLFDLGVQLQFGKKSTILNILRKVMLHYIKDYPFEVIADQEKIIEQLILYGNSNDLELKSCAARIYEVILSKMNYILEDMSNLNMKSPIDSQLARNHINSLADKDYLRISYPSLDRHQYSREAFENKLSQTSLKVYSLITVLDGIIKNAFNFCTEDIMISNFINLMVHYIIPILKKLYEINQTQIRKMVFGYIGLFRRLLEHTNLEDPRQSLFLVPAIKVSLSLLRIIGMETIKIEEYLSNRGYFVFVFDCYLSLLLEKSDFKDGLDLMIKFDKEQASLVRQVQDVLVSLEYLREIEKTVLEGSEQPGSFMSDKLEQFKLVHSKLKQASDSLFFAKEVEGIIELYITNHLRTVLLKSQSETDNIDPEFNHYNESVELLANMVSSEVEGVILHLMRNLLFQLESTDTVGFPGMAAMAKDLTYRALSDKQLTSILFVAGLNHPSLVVICASYDLLHVLTKKIIDKTELDKSPLITLLPLIMRDRLKHSKAKLILEMVAKRSKRFLLYQVFIGLFSSDRNLRKDYFCNIFKLEFFDKCLPFKGAKEIHFDIDIGSFDQTVAENPFSDPLIGICDPEGNVVYNGKLSIFKDKENKLGRITQAQIKSLFELLTVALNDNLEFSVRSVALDQIHEAIYFYRDSPSLKDYCLNIIKVCMESLKDFGSKRENFSILISKMKPLDESFISSKSERDIPIQNKYYEDEKNMISKYLSILNTIIYLFKHLGESRSSILESIIEKRENKVIFRTLWILSTEKDIETRYQSLLLLNILFFGSHQLYSIITGKNSEKLPDSANPIPNLKIYSTDYKILFKGHEYHHLVRDHPLKDADDKRKTKIVNFIESFIALAKGPEGKHCGFDPEVNKEKLEKVLVERKVSSSIGKYIDALIQDPSISNIDVWVNNSLVTTYINRTDFLESDSIYENYLDQLLAFLQKGDDENFTKYNSHIIDLISSREFRMSYSSNSVLQTFLHRLNVYYHENLLPLIYEYHVDKFADKYEVILGVFRIMKSTIQLVVRTNDQKLFVLIRGFVTRNSFIEFLFDLLRKYESMDFLNTVLIGFLRWHFDIFMKKGVEGKFMQTVSFLFDSGLICNRTDNFFGTTRLISILELAHSLCCRNQILQLSAKNANFDEIKQIGKDDHQPSHAFKTTTVAWIVSLLDHRSVRVRMMCWNILSLYLDSNLLDIFPTLVENCVSTINLINESTGVLALCYSFLSKVCKIVRASDTIGSEINENNTQQHDIGIVPGVSRRLDGIELVKVLHQRKMFDTVRKLLSHPYNPDILIASVTRFLVEWLCVEPDNILNKYFHTDFLEKYVQILQIEPDIIKNEFQTEDLKSVCERTNKAILVFHFLRKSSFSNPVNCKALLKNFSFLNILQDWLDYSSNIMRQQVVFECHFNQYNKNSSQGKELERLSKELALNIIATIEVLINETEEMFLFTLNENEGGKRNGRSFFSSFADILTHDSNDSALGYSVLKIIAKLLLKWNKGYSLIDEDGPGTCIAEHLISRCMCFFKNIDYTRISDKDYLNIINSEELLHILAILVSKSDLMKERFLVSGLFTLYITKFIQIINSFKKNISFISVGPEKKELYEKHIQSVSANSRPNQSSRHSNNKLNSSTISRQSTEKQIPTKTTRLNQNIKAITENSVGHIKAYSQIMKYFFHNCQRTPSQEKINQNTSHLEKSTPEMMTIINFLWTEGQLDDVRVSNY